MKPLLIFITLILSAISVLAQDLAVDKLFDGRYNNNPHTSVTIITNDNTQFRSIDVKGDSRIVKEMEALMQKDRSKAYNCVEEYKGGKYSLLYNIGNNITVGLDKDSDSKASLFVSRSGMSRHTGRTITRSSSSSSSKKSKKNKKKTRTDTRTETYTITDGDVAIYTTVDGRPVTITTEIID